MRLAALAKADLPWHAKIAYIGTSVKNMDAEAPVSLEHIFEKGWYIREMVIPADTVFIGRPHRFGHRVEFLSGSGRLISAWGETEIAPPWSFFTQPGWITVLHAYRPLKLRTYHANPDECRDTHLMESIIFHPPEEMQLVATMVERKLMELT